MRSCDGSVVRSAWAYARTSDGIIVLCRRPVCVRIPMVSMG